MSDGKGNKHEEKRGVRSRGGGGGREVENLRVRVIKRNGVSVVEGVFERELKRSTGLY